jgi:hypothetical protein
MIFKKRRRWRMEMASNRSGEDRKTTEEMVPPQPISVTLAEMGKVIDAEGRIVHLSKEFLLARLKPTCFDDILIEHGAKPRSTGLVCPFCNRGQMTLLLLDPLYRAEGRNERRPQDQIGSKYLYECSNPACHARFWANYHWEDTPWEEKKK